MRLLNALLISACLIVLTGESLAQDAKQAPLTPDQLSAMDPQIWKEQIKNAIEKHGAQSNNTAGGYFYLSMAYVRRGQEMPALEAAEKNIEILERNLTAKQLASIYQSTFHIMHNVGFVHATEALAIRAMPFVAREFGVSSAAYRDLLERLALAVSQSKGREEEALQLAQRARKAYEADLFQGKVQISQLLVTEAGLHRRLGQSGEADEKYRQAIRLADERSLIAKNSKEEQAVGSLTVRVSYAGDLISTDRLDEAETMLTEMKKLAPETGMYRPIAMAAVQAVEYMAKRKRGDFAGALELIRQIEANQTRGRTISIPQAGPHLIFYPDFYLATGDYLSGLESLEKSYSTFKDHGQFIGMRVGDRDSRSLANELAVKGIASGVIPKERAINISATYQQASQLGGAGIALEKMAARASNESGELGRLAREYEREKGNKALIQNELQKVASAGPNPQAERLQSLDERLNAAKTRMLGLEAELQQKFPKYLDLVKPAPLSVQETGRLLSSNEAVLLYSLTDDSAHVLLIRRDGAELLPLQGNRRSIETAVRRLRATLSPSDMSLPAFDTSASNKLYRQIVEPALPHLKGIKHLIVVPDGALGSLPMGVLVRSLSPNAQPLQEDYRSVDWLAQGYAFSTLPSLSALRALRGAAGGATGSRPIVGFGDPVLAGSGQDRQLATVRSLFAGNSSVANVEAIRKAPSLPETADELRAIAKLLKADGDALYLGERASETRVKQMDLTPYQLVAFSTHGVTAGELPGLYEPGLIMTPPEVGSEQDDGYLSASEISQLKLNADWVLLSACNTASSDGRPGAEDLSGLARAFFYAGARSLLVSHWPVDSKATKELVVGVITEMAKTPGLAKAEALQRASLSLSKKKELSHPFFWAPFVVAGEGGASLSGTAKR